MLSLNLMAIEEIKKKRGRPRGSGLTATALTVTAYNIEDIVRAIKREILFSRIKRGKVKHERYDLGLIK